MSQFFQQKTKKLIFHLDFGEERALILILKNILLPSTLRCSQFTKNMKSILRTLVIDSRMAFQQNRLYIPAGWV